MWWNMSPGVKSTESSISSPIKAGPIDRVIDIAVSIAADRRSHRMQLDRSSRT